MAYEAAVLQQAVRRLRAQRERRRREKEALRDRLYRECPDLPRLDAALRSTMAEVAELALSHDPDCAAKLRDIRGRNLALQRERTALLARMGYGPDAMDDTPACAACGDTGWVGAQMCTCLKQLCVREQVRQLSSLLDLGEQSFDRMRLDVYSDQPWKGQGRSPREHMRQVAAVCQGYARQFPDYPLKNLFFTGGTGLGKTFLSACIAREVSERGFSVVYDTAINVFSRFEARRFARDAGQEREAQDDTRRYLGCDLLILDDLGAEFTGPMAQSALYELVNSRLGKHWRTIISSNLPIEDIRRRYSPQIASRLEGEYQELTFYGEDIRLRKER